MKATISNIILPADTWVNLYLAPAVIAAGILVGDRLSLTNINGQIDLNFSETPDQESGFTPLQKGFEISNSLGSLGAWAISRGANGLINVGENVTSEIPGGAFSGTRAMTVASYTEQNSKAGVQHEGSTLLVAVPGLSSNNTIFKTGALPVSLKGRVIGYTGEGVTASIFTGATFTGGTSVPYQNATDINPIEGLSEIIVGATIDTEGTLAFAPDNLIGNKSNQGQGTSGATIGRESILAPNTVYLFRLTSLDAAAQDIASLLSWYEGELDLPL